MLYSMDFWRQFFFLGCKDDKILGMATIRYLRTFKGLSDTKAE
jgi:hypothetical protein